MDSVRASISIARVCDDVFAYVADQRQRARLLPDNFTDVRMLTPHHTGLGARFRFTVRTDHGAYDSETELVAYSPPDSLRERTEDGTTEYETRWQFSPDGVTTRVDVEMHYQMEGNIVTRLLARTFGRRALAQSLLVELVRLKQQLEAP